MALSEIKALVDAINDARGTGSLHADSEANVLFCVSEDEYAELDWPEQRLGAAGDHIKKFAAELRTHRSGTGYRFIVAVEPCALPRAVSPS